MQKKILNNNIIVWLRNYLGLSNSKLNYNMINEIETLFKCCNDKEIKDFLLKNQKKNILEYSLFTSVQYNNLEITKFLLYSNEIKDNPSISVWNENNQSSLLSHAVLYDAKLILSYLLEEKYKYFLEVKLLKTIIPRVVYKKNLEIFYENSIFKNLQYFESEKDLTYTFTCVTNLEVLNYLLDNLHNNKNHINLDMNIVIKDFYNMVSLNSSLTANNEVSYDISTDLQNNKKYILLNSFIIIMGILQHNIHQNFILNKDNLILILEQCSRYYDNENLYTMNIIEKLLEKIIKSKSMSIEEIKNYDSFKTMCSYLDRHIILQHSLNIKTSNGRKMKI